MASPSLSERNCHLDYEERARVVGAASLFPRLLVTVQLPTQSKSLRDCQVSYAPALLRPLTPCVVHCERANSAVPSIHPLSPLSKSQQFVCERTGLDAKTFGQIEHHMLARETDRLRLRSFDDFAFLPLLGSDTEVVSLHTDVATLESGS